MTGLSVEVAAATITRDLGFEVPARLLRGDAGGALSGPYAVPAPSTRRGQQRSGNIITGALERIPRSSRARRRLARRSPRTASRVRRRRSGLRRRVAAVRRRAQRGQPHRRPGRARVRSQAPCVEQGDDVGRVRIGAVQPAESKLRQPPSWTWVRSAKRRSLSACSSSRDVDASAHGLRKAARAFTARALLLRVWQGPCSSQVPSLCSAMHLHRTSAQRRLERAGI